MTLEDEILVAARRRVSNALHEMHVNQQIWISPELAHEIDAAWSAYDAAILATAKHAAS
jgi:hypothetical protein